jgi:hypothetical protein
MGNALHKTKKRSKTVSPSNPPKKKSMKNSTLKNVNGANFNINERIEKEV